MHSIITSFLLAFAFFLLVRSGDLTFSCVIARSIVRSIIYGIAFVWLLIIFVLTLFGFIAIPM